MKNVLRAFAAMALLVASSAVNAAITCGVTSGGFATAYDPATPTTNITQASFTVTCTKGLAGDPPSVNFSVRVDNGLYSLGINNRAAFGTRRIRYDVYTNSTCGSPWKGATAISGTVNTPSVGTFTATGTFWGCVAAGFAVPAGTYTDTVTMTMTYGATSSTAVGSFNVWITTPPTCAITSAPTNVVFNYVSFGAAVNAAGAFGVTCSLALPYTMALDSGGGTIVGLAYTIALSTTASTGTGAQQMHTVNGNMAAGQSGVCALPTCSVTQAHSVTITY